MEYFDAGVRLMMGAKRSRSPTFLCSCPDQPSKKVPATLNLTTISLTFPAFKFPPLWKASLFFQTEAPPQRRTLLMIQLSPRGRAVRAKKPGNHCCVLGFQAHTHLSQGWNLPTKSYLLARYNYYFEHFQTAYQDVITQDVTMPLDSSKHPSPT